MIQETINYVMQRMDSCLDNGQMIRLKGVMDEVAQANETDSLEKDSVFVPVLNAATTAIDVYVAFQYVCWGYTKTYID